MKRAELAGRRQDLGYLPRDCVRWLSPLQLLRTGAKVGFAEVFAGYADKRESQAGLEVKPIKIAAGPDEDGLWIDFVADLGDGFDATFTVAGLLAEPSLELTDPVDHGKAHRLPRGALLVMGGDEVYPVASTADYEDRTVGPYRSALPEADPSPTLLALPGNHDWYDGLTSFQRTFTQERSIGGWRTVQKRSYFAVELSEHWWLAGLDSQLGTLIDEPQLKYFEANLTSWLKPGDAVIVCAATPTWVKAATGDPDAFNALHWFERNYIRNRKVAGSEELVETGAHVRLWITGDSHHYARYWEDPAQMSEAEPLDPRRTQMITCGLGGAYQSQTHRLPSAISVPPENSGLREKEESVQFVRGDITYPAQQKSQERAKRLALPWRAEWLPRRNPGFAKLAGLLHMAGFLLLSLILGLTIGIVPWSAGSAEPGQMFQFDLSAVVVAGAALLLRRLSNSRRAANQAPGRPAADGFWGATAATQVLLALVMVNLCAFIPWGGAPRWLAFLTCLAITAVLGSLVGSQLFAVTILGARAGHAVDWQMSGQSVEDGKGFVRMHIDSGGDLTVYPVVIDKVCHDWALDRSPKGGVRPRPAHPVTDTRLLEQPVVISRKGFQG